MKWGGEIRHHLAKVEPWLHNGWQIISRFPEFYPEGKAIYNRDLFREIDEICAKYHIIGAYGALYIPPRHEENYGLKFEPKENSLNISCDNVVPVVTKALAETELRQLFMKWFYAPERHIMDYDHYVLSFSSSALGNSTYYDGYALLPGYLPPKFLNPPDPIAPHVGVQIRKMAKTAQRNSDPQWMLQTASQIAEHLGLELMVYGHENGCYLPESGYRLSWDTHRPEGHMARELGYLKSCRVMLAPDSGWADLMVWLGVPTFLEMQLLKGTMSPFWYGIKDFRPRLRVFDRQSPAGTQTDALLNDPPWELPAEPWAQQENPQLFPILP